MYAIADDAYSNNGQRSQDNCLGMVLECRRIAIDTHRTRFRCNDGAIGKPVKHFLDAIDDISGINDGLTHRSGYERKLAAAHTTTAGDRGEAGWLKQARRRTSPVR